MVLIIKRLWLFSFCCQSKFGEPILNDISRASATNMGPMMAINERIHNSSDMGPKRLWRKSTVGKKLAEVHHRSAAREDTWSQSKQHCAASCYWLFCARRPQLRRPIRRSRRLRGHLFRSLLASGQRPLQHRQHHCSCPRLRSGRKKRDRRRDLGRSRVGFTSKLHCLVDARWRPFAFHLTVGEAAVQSL